MSLLLLDTVIIAIGSWLTKEVVNYLMLLLLSVKYICLRRADMRNNANCTCNFVQCPIKTGCQGRSV